MPASRTGLPCSALSTRARRPGSGAVFKGTTHETLCGDFAHRAKVVIRSGSFEPWANFALVASTDPFAWFTTESGVKPLPAYVERRARMTAREVPELA